MWAEQQIERRQRPAVRPTDGLFVADIDVAKTQSRENAATNPRIRANAALALQLVRRLARWIDHVDEHAGRAPTRGMIQHAKPLLVRATAWAAASTTAVFPLLALVAITVKWLVIGRVRPGRYPLWSVYYVRWWFVPKPYTSQALLAAVTAALAAA